VILQSGCQITGRTEKKSFVKTRGGGDAKQGREVRNAKDKGVFGILLGAGGGDCNLRLRKEERGSGVLRSWDCTTKAQKKRGRVPRGDDKSY